MRRDRRLLLLLPSAVLLLLTLVCWSLWPPPRLEPRAGAAALVALGLASALLLLGSGWLLARISPSFRSASDRLERLVRDLRATPAQAFGMALLTGLSEELFFRGWLLHVIGPWGQAAIFMLMHPAGRQAWVYTLFTGAAGLLFGWLTLASGSLLPALVAHVAVNAYGFLAGRRSPAGW